MERVVSAGDSEGESSSVGSSVETSSEDSEEEETDPQVKEEVGCRNDGIRVCRLSLVDTATAHKSAIEQGGNKDWHDISSSSFIVYSCLCESKE